MKNKLQRIYKNFSKLFYGTGIGKNRIVSKTNRYFTSQLKPDFIEIDNIKYFLDKTDSLGLSISHIHEKTETDFIKKEIHEGDIVVDVGAHIGYFTLIFSKLVGDNGKVYSFEADPTNFEILMKNLEVNKIKNVTCENFAISDKNGKVKLFNANSSTANRLFSSEDENFIEIESITLDEYFQDKNMKIDFLKLDIQGAEPLAMKGMKELFKKNQPLKILLEWWPNGIKKLGEEPESHLKFLENKGYQISEIDDKNREILETNVKQLMKKYPNKQIEDINLICKKTE